MRNLSGSRHIRTRENSCRNIAAEKAKYYTRFNIYCSFTVAVVI